MEQWQKDILRDNLTKIQPNIRISVLFNYFYENRVFEDHDIEELNNCKSTSDKLRELFKILGGRVGGYAVLIKALEETGQSGVVATLRGAEASRGNEITGAITTPGNKNNEKSQVELKSVGVLIGQGDYTVQRVVNRFKKHNSFHLFAARLMDIGNDLEVDPELLRSVKRSFDKDDLDSVGALRQILALWVANSGSSATVEVLSKVLRDNHLAIFAEMLRN